MSGTSGNDLATERMAAGLTGASVAHEMGVSKQRVHAIERMPLVPPATARRFRAALADVDTPTRADIATLVDASVRSPAEVHRDVAAALARAPSIRLVTVHAGRETEVVLAAIGAAVAAGTVVQVHVGRRIAATVTTRGLIMGFDT